MKKFSTLTNIDNDLLKLFEEIERYFSIELDKRMIGKIFQDSVDDHVSEKKYEIFKGVKGPFRTQLSVHGTVDEYEPSDIWIEIRNVSQNDVDHFDNLF